MNRRNRDRMVGWTVAIILGLGVWAALFASLLGG